jgi:hypothetical protein
VTPLLAGVSATPWSVLSGTRSRDAPCWLSHLARRRGEAPRTNDSTIWPPEMTIFSGLGFWKTTRTTSGFDSEAGRSWDCSRPRSTAQPCRIGQCIVVAFPPWRKLPAEHRRMTDLGQPGVCVWFSAGHLSRSVKSCMDLGLHPFQATQASKVAGGQCPPPVETPGSRSGGRACRVWVSTPRCPGVPVLAPTSRPCEARNRAREGPSVLNNWFEDPRSANPAVDEPK